MLPSALATTLANDADPVVANVLASGGARTPKPSCEVSAVRTMTLDGFDGIAKAWLPTLKAHGYRIDLRAVFCHSRPHVTFAPIPHPKHPGGRSPRVCELADLLIVIDHVDPFQKIDERRAVLVQAKILKSGKLALSGKEWVQHELLAWLPAFTFVDPGYDPRSRNLNGTPLIGSLHHTSEYGGIDLKTSPPIWRHELTQTTAPWFNSPVGLGRFLAGMATGDSHFSREAVRGGTDHWSFTVDELLRVTAAIPISGKGGDLRGNDKTVGFIVDTSSLSDAGEGGGGVGGIGADPVEGDVPEWPEGPISTIQITFRSIDDLGE